MVGKTKEKEREKMENWKEAHEKKLISPEERVYFLCR